MKKDSDTYCCYSPGSYGDKTPKTILARVYASLWMIVGLMLMSVITAQVSSSITADGLRPLDALLGDRVCEDTFLLYSKTSSRTSN